MDDCLVTLIYIGAFKGEYCKHACNEHTREKEEKQNIVSKQLNPKKTNSKYISYLDALSLDVSFSSFTAVFFL